MAKAKQVQLQTDITNDEDWAKFLQRDGLLVIDIYSEWCGPCVAMQGNLKKIKLESGGDFLNLGMARSDNIEALKRFRMKSEPTWMFIAQGQQVNLMFGSNAPELQRIVMNEMLHEKEVLEGRRERKQRLPEEYSEEEQIVYEKVIAQDQERERIKVEKICKQVKDRRVAQAKNILDTMAHLGLMIIFPHAIKKHYEVLDEFLPHTGIAISKKDRPALTLEEIEEIEFLSAEKMPDICKTHLTQDKALAYMLTVDIEMNPGPIDDTILRFCYGPTKIAPGEPGTPAYALLKSQINKKVVEEVKPPEPVPGLDEGLGADDLGEGEGDEEEEEEAMEEQSELPPPVDPMLEMETSSMRMMHKKQEEGAEEEDDEAEEEQEEEDIWGMWAPPNELVKSTAFKYCFPLITSALILPEPEPIPPHLAIAFEVFKKQEVYKLMDEYDSEIMAYGFFSTDQVEEAQLVAKTKKSYEKTYTGVPQYGEKIILKVAKRKSDPILAFAQLGPTYMSSNVDVGERDCSILFPENYDEIDVKTEAPAKKETAPTESTSDVLDGQEDMIFDSVLHGGEEEEDIGELVGDVEAIPPMEMSELPLVEEEEEGVDKSTSPPPPPPVDITPAQAPPEEGPPIEASAPETVPTELPPAEGAVAEVPPAEGQLPEVPPADAPPDESAEAPPAAPEEEAPGSEPTKEASDE